MFAKSKFILSSVGILLLGLTACGQSGPVQESTAKSVSVADIPEMIAPVVDRQTGTLTPGSAQFSANYYYVALLDNIVRDARNTCMMNLGYSGALSSFRETHELYKVEVSANPWLVEHAEVYAFFPPQPLADLLANGVQTETFSEQDLAQREIDSKEKTEEHLAFLDAIETPEYKAAFSACEDDPEVQKWASIDIWDKSRGPWLQEFQGDRTEAFQDERFTAVKQEYVACLQNNGLQPEGPTSTDIFDLFAVAGQSYEVIDEQQVRLAVQVVACKDEVQATERTMEIWAQYEAVTYLQYEAELLEAHAYLQELQAELDNYLTNRKS